MSVIFDFFSLTHVLSYHTKFFAVYHFFFCLVVYLIPKTPEVLVHCLAGKEQVQAYAPVL